MRQAPLHIVVFLLLIMATQLLHKVVFISYFQLNRAYIIQKHCINKDKPEMQCDGKCHLKKYTSVSDVASSTSNELPLQEFPDLSFFKSFNPYFIVQPSASLIISNSYFIFLLSNKHKQAFSYLTLKGRIFIHDLLLPPIS